LADSVSAVCQFVEDFSRRPWSLVSRKRALLGSLKRIWNSLTFNPVQWYLIWSTNFRTFIWARSYACSRRAHLAGEDVLDPQYFEHPKGISFEDLKMYFEPIRITDARGELCEWLRPNVPKQLQKPPSAAKMKPRRAKLPQARDLSAKQNFRGDLLLK